jgi:hypothetical protein
MTGVPPNNPGQDPAEGSRETIERELRRSASDRSKATGGKSKPGDAGDDSRGDTKAGKGKKSS